MAPAPAPILSAGLPPRATDTNDQYQGMRDQFLNPNDIFSILLILGGEVVARAVAQLAGSGLTPVTFSFGK